MTKMVHAIAIARRPVEVLDYASSAVCWPEWHPSSLRVAGPQGPLVAGARFEEDVRAGGREGHLRWDVVEHSSGTRFVARARGDRYGLELTLTYDCHPLHDTTRFVRTLEYSLSSWPMKLVNALVLSRKIERESRESLEILKRVIERRAALDQ